MLQQSGGKDMKTFLKVVIWAVVIILIIFLTLFISSKVAGFDTIGDLLRYLVKQF